MKKVLIAVDDTKGADNAFALSSEICSYMLGHIVLCIVLLYVEKFEGKSLIDEMLGDAEMSALKEVLEGTEFKDRLDEKARKILGYYKKALADKGMTRIKTVIKAGHPADEILKTAKEEAADMIMIGARGKRVSHLFMGSVSREVANRAEIPVLVVR